jgi:hypothetical protein
MDFYRFNYLRIAFRGGADLGGKFGDYRARVRLRMAGLVFQLHGGQADLVEDARKGEAGAGREVRPQGFRYSESLSSAPPLAVLQQVIDGLSRQRRSKPHQG